MDLVFLQNAWFFIIGAMLAVYSLLDGFDLGVGIALPFLSKNERDTGTLFSAIGPVWDGNEVWLVAGGASLFAAFPLVYATVFSGFYLALMLVLFALIFRAVSIEFWSLDKRRKTVWKWSFCAGSFIPSLLFGVALGNLILGIPMDAKMNYTGGFFFLLRPYPVSIGLLGLFAIILQGLTYTAVKTRGDIQTNARKSAIKTGIAHGCLFLLSILCAVIFLKGKIANPAAWIFSFIFFLSLCGVLLSLKKGHDKKSFILSSTSFASLWGIAGSLLYPNLVNSIGEGVPLSIYNASSSPLTLGAMLVIAIVGLPAAGIYTAYVYRVFKGKIKP